MHLSHGSKLLRFWTVQTLDAKGVVFVTRVKTNWQFKRTGQGVIDTNYGDFKIQFTSVTAIKKVGKENEFRAVRWYSKEDDRWFIFLTNASDDITAEQVAKLYKDRWQIEIFFKRMKQNLKCQATLVLTPLTTPELTPSS